MLFFRSKKGFLKAVTLFQSETGIIIQDRNVNQAVGEEWGVNLINVEHNRAFRKFVEKTYKVGANIVLEINTKKTSEVRNG